MREDPGLDRGMIAATLDAHYGVAAATITYLPIGFDLNAFVYEVVDDGGAAWFLKIRRGPVSEPALDVPRALIDAGVPNVLAPIRTRGGDLWCPLDGEPGFTCVLYPFIRGENAKSVGLTDDQWRTFGETLRAVHDSELAGRLRDEVRVETFALPSAALVREMLAVARDRTFDSPAANRFAACLRERDGEIRAILARAEELGRSLQGRAFEHSLCHTDIHTANILVGNDGRIWLIDWDSPLIAPRERDLFFVIGSRIARTVTPREEDLFFAGYGPVTIDRDALVYYRYERIVEDLGEFAKSVFLDPAIGEPLRERQAELGMGFFDPDGDIERAERVDLSRTEPAS